MTREIIDQLIINGDAGTYINAYRYAQRYLLPSCEVDRLVFVFYHKGVIDDEWEPYTHDMTIGGIMLIANEQRKRYFCSHIFRKSKNRPLWAMGIDLKSYDPIEYSLAQWNKINELPF